MNSHLTLFVCGPHARGTEQASLGDGIRTMNAAETRLRRTPAGVLNRFVQRVESEYLAFVDAEATIGKAPLENAIAALETTPEAIAGLASLNDSPNLVLQLWRQFPPRLASLVRGPDRQTAVIFRTKEWETLGRLNDVSDPIWDAMIRAAEQNRTVAIPEDGLTSAPVVPLSAIPDELPALVPQAPGPECDWLHAYLNRVPCEQLRPGLQSRPDAVALKAGLLQIHDDLEGSHELSQSVQGHRSGDYWHGIMHRREPDFGNSKYWFRRTGEHPVFEPLSIRAAEILDASAAADAGVWQRRLGCPQGWDPFAFVDFCQHCRSGTDSALTRATEEIQYIEMLLLLKQCFQDARG